MKAETIKENGFKETEIGLIPSDWDVVKLEDIFEVQQGKQLSPKSRQGISPKPFLRTANVFWSRIDLTTVDEMDFSSKEVKKLALKEDDLLVCEGGDIGRTAIWKNQLPVCLHQNHLHRLRASQDDVIPKFYMYWMQVALLYLRLYEGTGNKTTIPNLSQSRLRVFLFPKPSKIEQQKIASVLSKIQQAIEQQDKIMQITKELKKSLMNKFFTEGLHGEEQKETEIGMMPKSWDVVKICVAYEFTAKPRGLNIKEKSKIPFIPMEFISEEERIADKYELRDRVGSGTFVLKGDLIVAKITPSFENGKQGIIENIPFEFAYATTEVWPVHSIRGKSDINYLYYYLKKQSVRVDVAGKMEGSTGRQRVPKNVLENLLIPLPPLSEQEEIVSIFISLDKKLSQSESRKQTLQSLFKTILNQLMTGKVRVKDLDIEVN